MADLGVRWTSPWVLARTRRVEEMECLRRGSSREPDRSRPAWWNRTIGSDQLGVDDRRGALGVGRGGHRDHVEPVALEVEHGHCPGVVGTSGTGTGSRLGSGRSPFSVRSLNRSLVHH